MYLVIAVLCILYLLTLVWALRHGHSLGDIVRYSAKDGRSGLAVAWVCCLIGCVTGIWRSCGAIPFLVYYGVHLVVPPLFLLLCFLLCCLMSYALGTSFGVAGTLGVVLMTLAKSGDVNIAMTAGAILSGVFFGDRCSPVSATANLIAGLTETDLFENVKRMFLRGLPALGICALLYLGLSLLHPLGSAKAEIFDGFAAHFSLSPWAALPAIPILVLPFFHLSIHITLGSSILAGAFVAHFLQGESPAAIGEHLFLGYRIDDPLLGPLLDGGGIMSMATVIPLILVSCCLAGLFNGIGGIEAVSSRLSPMIRKAGSMPLMIGICLAASAVFCNQVISIVLCHALLRPRYEETGTSPTELALDLEDCSVTVPVLIPWSIVCLVPLDMLDATPLAILFAFYLYVLPLASWWRQSRARRKVART